MKTEDSLLKLGGYATVLTALHLLFASICLLLRSVPQLIFYST